jgi:arylsulfatase A-like enzyme
VWLAAAVACLIAASLVQRRSFPWPERGVAKILVAVPLMVAVTGITAILLGRSALPALPTRTEGPPDILLMVLDTTRADFAPAGPDAPVPTPNLSRMAAEGVRFTRAFSTSCWTLPAHGSLFTGLVPSEHGATWSSERLPDGVTTLAEQLRAAGRRTGAFSANPWITPEFGFDRGFERFFVGDADRHPMKPGLVGSLPALFAPLGAATLFEDAGGLVVASEALTFLGSDDGPAFVFLNFMEPHLPYIPPNRFLVASPDSEWNRRSLGAVDQDLLRDLRPGGERSRREIDGLRRLYAGEVAYVDWLLGRILGRLEDSNRLDDTIVVVTSDHGENLGQHPPLDHQLGLFDTLVHVPLLIRYSPAFPAGSIRDDLVSLVDIPPALLSLATDEGHGRGGPLLEGRARRVIFIEYDRPAYILERIRDRLAIDPEPWDRTLRGVRTSELKWIEASDGRHEAYDLRADPGEQRNLVEERGTVPEAVSPLAGILDEVSSRWVPRAESEPPPPISEEMAERLRSLGYLP